MNTSCSETEQIGTANFYLNPQHRISAGLVFFLFYSDVLLVLLLQQLQTISLHKTQ